MQNLKAVAMSVVAAIAFFWPNRPNPASHNIYTLKYGGPPADGGHPGGRRTGGHPGGRRTGGRYTTDGHTCLRYGRREDTEGAPTWRQGRCTSTLTLTLNKKCIVRAARMIMEHDVFICVICCSMASLTGATPTQRPTAEC